MHVDEATCISKSSGYRIKKCTSLNNWVLELDINVSFYVMA